MADPRVIFRMDPNDSSIGEIVGSGGEYAFPESNDRLYGTGAWKLWHLPAAGESRILLDEGVSSSGYLPTLAMDHRRIVWAAFIDAGPLTGASQPMDDAMSELRMAGMNDSQVPRTLLSYRAVDSLLWYPALNADELWFGIIHGDWENGVQDDIRVETLDLANTGSAPIEFAGVGREFNPVADDRFVVWKSPQPGFAALNWGDVFVLDRATQEKIHVIADGGRPSLGNRFMTLDVISHRQLNLFDLDTSALTRPLNLSPAGTQTVGGAHVRGDLLTFFRQDSAGSPTIGWAILPH